MARKKKKEKTVVQVVNGKLNVRKEPSLDSEVVSVLDDRSLVKVEVYDSTWFKIDDGYIMSEFTKPIEQDMTSTCDGNMEETYVS